MKDPGIFLWVLTGFSLLGTFLNIKKNRVCFLIWTVTNASWCIYDLVIRSYAQAALFGVYGVMAVWGWFSWKKSA